MATVRGRLYGKYTAAVMGLYKGHPALTRKKVRALISVYPVLIIAGFLFIALYGSLVGFTTDILIVVVAVVMLFIGWFLLARSRYRLSVALLIAVLQFVLTSTVFISANHEPIKMYNLAVYCILSLLMAGLVGDRSWYAFLVMAVSFLLMTLYLLFFVIPAGLKTMELTIDAYISAMVLTGMAAAISILFHRQIYGLVQELSESNDSLDRKVEERTAQLESSRKQLLETEKISALSSMVSGIAHEMNTPLGICVTARSFQSDAIATLESHHRSGKLAGDDFSTFFETCADSDSLMKTSLERLKQNIQRFRGLSAEFLPEEMTALDASEILDDVVEFFSSDIAARPEVFLVNTTPGPVMVRTHREFCRKTVSQLVENSLLHGFPDREGRIRLECRLENRELELIVADDGVGMSPESVERLFEPFYTTVRGRGHQGLGMTLVHTLVSRLDGRVKVHSNPGEGTVVTIFVPAE